MSEVVPEALKRERLVEQIREIAHATGKRSVPKHEFLRKTGLSERQVTKVFDTYSDLVVAAGLEPSKFPTGGELVYLDRELLEEVTRVLRLPDAKLTRSFFDRHGAVGTSVCGAR